MGCYEARNEKRGGQKKEHFQKQVQREMGYKKRAGPKLMPFRKTIWSEISYKKRAGPKLILHQKIGGPPLLGGNVDGPINGVDLKYQEIKN